MSADVSAVEPLGVCMSLGGVGGTPPGERVPGLPGGMLHGRQLGVPLLLATLPACCWLHGSPAYALLTTLGSMCSHTVSYPVIHFPCAYPSRLDTLL
jgi:hypothetical protein